jgi:hypothetical protein
MKESLSDFNEFRREMNEEIHASDHLGMKRFFCSRSPGVSGRRAHGEDQGTTGSCGISSVALRRLHHLPPGAVRRGGLEARRSD